MSTHTTANIGKRALVTGASSGIGAAIARELAALGVDLVLTARRRDALDAVAATCKGVNVEIVTADLGQPDAARALWDAATASGPIDILINNAGFGYFRRFDEVDWARDAELVQLNMTSLVALARCFVDAHKASTRPAHMVNIASTGAYQSVPNMALYAASKAFVRNFSEGLHDEHRGTSLSVTSSVLVAPKPPSTLHPVGATTRGSRTRRPKARSLWRMPRSARCCVASARLCPACSTSCRASVCAS